MQTVLLFNNCAAAERAARVHVEACPVVAAARASKGKVKVIGGDFSAEVEDLNERGFTVRTCRCAKKGGAQ